MAQDDRDDRQRVALVTGAGTGIGAAAAEALAARGYAVGVNYCTSAQAADEVVARIRDRGGQALAVQADVADRGAVRAMTETVVGAFGGLDVLVANAGTPVIRTALADLSEADWDRCIDINLKGVFLCAQAAIPALRASAAAGRSPAILIIGSAAVHTGGTESGHYAAAKAGAHALVRPLAKELAPGIAVNCLAPGYVDTPFHDKFHVPGRREKTVGATPLQRAGQPGDLATWVTFLVEAPFVTGQVFHVNGGSVMP